MPFSKHYIEPEHMEAMRAVFKKVCDLLKCDVDDPMTEIIVNKIVVLRKAGGYDADRLAELVLNDLVDDGQPPLPSRPPVKKINPQYFGSPI
jgi:hypothetical protein